MFDPIPIHPLWIFGVCCIAVVIDRLACRHVWNDYRWCSRCREQEEDDG